MRDPPWHAAVHRRWLKREEHVAQFPPGKRFIVHGKSPGPTSLRLDSNDYLRVTGHPDIVAAQKSVLEQSAGNIVQSGVFLLESDASHVLERDLSQYLGKEDGILCQSGYAANIGLLQCIADASTPVYLDASAHASLWEGAHAARAPMHLFLHNNPDHLDRLMQKHGAGVVVVDSVYSTTGALCPLVQMVEIAEKHGSMIVVDESHSLGTHGPGGAGACAAAGLTSRVHFITASLAKSFAARAGFFTIPQAMREYVLTTSFPNIFSSALLPYEVAGLQATLELLKQADDRRERLFAISRRVREMLTEMGYPIQQGSEQIIGLEAGTEWDTVKLREALEDADVFGSVFCAPATSINRALVRLTLHSEMTETDIQKLENALRDILPVVQPWTWPISKRLLRKKTGSSD